MKTGIVVLNYNDAKETIDFIRKISQYSVLDIICIVDNASTDDSLSILKRIRKPNVKVLSAPQNKGYAAGNNIGLRYLYEQNCEYFIVSNPDIIVDEINMNDFVSFMKSYPQYDCFGPTIKENNTLNRGWKLSSIGSDILDNIPYLNRLFKHRIRYSNNYYTGPLAMVDCVSGCFFGLTKKAIDTVGFLDEGTFLYYEENIYGKKIKDAGLQTVVLNQVSVIHNHSVTINKVVNRYQKLRILKDSQIYYHKVSYKHSKFSLFLLKKTADFACFIARLRTSKKILNTHSGPNKKVTILSLHMKVGGIEKAISSLSNMLIDDYDVEIINVYKLVDTPSFYIDERVNIRYLSTDIHPNKESFKEAIKYKDIKAIIKEGLYAIKVLYRKRKLIKNAAKDCTGDIIVSSTLAFNKYFSKYQKDKVLVAWEHCHPNGNKKYIKKVIKKTKKFDVFIPSSKSLYEFYKKYIVRPKCMYVPLCIDEMPKETAELQTNQITVMGRLSKEKAYDDMLLVFKEVLRQNNQAILNIVGDGEERESLKKIAEHLGISEAVVFHGNLLGDQKHQVLLNTSVFVTTSHFESFGLVLLEAMSYGIPCVSFTSAQGSIDIIDDGQDGYLIENRNTQAMSQMIVSLLEKTTKTMKNNAIKKARQYSYKNVRAKWLEAFAIFSQGDISKRVIFTSSAGGHFSELSELQPLMDCYNSFLITEDHQMMQDYKKENDVRAWYLRAGTKEHLVKFLWNFPFNIVNSFRIYLKVRPDVVIATGAHTTVPICYISKLFRKRVIYIETFANITTKSLSGKLVYPIADLFLVQWEEMLTLYPKAKYKGWLK